MPQGVCDVGPVGIQTVNRDRLSTALGAVQGRIDGARRAAAVVPTGWIRTHLFQFSDLPRRQSELDQVVRWRLKKLLPVLPSELRVSAIPQRAVDGQKPLLCMVGVERAFQVGIFDPALGGDPLLFQHLFWFYSHPVVYIMVLPSMGVVSETIEVTVENAPAEITPMVFDLFFLRLLAKVFCW